VCSSTDINDVNRSRAQLLWMSDKLDNKTGRELSNLRRWRLTF